MLFGDDAVVALHSALELHGVANQVFQTVYYFSARARKDVAFGGVTYHRVAPPKALASHPLFQTALGTDNVLVTERERSLVDCLMYLDYGGGAEESTIPWLCSPPLTLMRLSHISNSFGNRGSTRASGFYWIVTPTNSFFVARSAITSFASFPAVSSTLRTNDPGTIGLPPGN